MANIILVHQNKVSGSNTNSDINALIVSVFGSQWREENIRATGETECTRTSRDQALNTLYSLL